MDEDINFNNFDYVTFVDASGDDGFKFDKESSLCYTAGCFLTKTEDINYNFDILNKIKETAHCKIKDELKHKQIRKRKNCKKILSVMNELKGINISLNVFKKDLFKDEKLKSEFTGKNNKNLAAIAHTFPIFGLNELGFLNNKKILICIDRMKITEMDKVKYFFKTEFSKKSKTSNYKLIFKDSKAQGFELIQIADLIAGILREFYEITYYKNQEYFSFLKRCAYCRDHQCRYNLCNKKIYKKVKNNILNLNIKYLSKNFITNDIGMYSMFTIPRNNIKYYSMFFCRK